MSNEGQENVLNGVNESEDDLNTMTLGDILEDQKRLQENADAVLGPGDDKICTSAEGYKKRQALYSCLSCTPPDGKERAGICLACSYHCHEDHDLVELFTKRNFKCDCGNSLFKGRCCFLDPAKSGINEDNTYNQNFEGKYCSCKRPYPDPEDDIYDEMVQCVVCEDWFHTRHLGVENVPKEFAEMICGACTDQLPFLQCYLGHSVSQVINGDENDSIVNVSVAEGDTSISSPQKQVVENGSPNTKLLPCANENGTPNTKLLPCANENGTPNTKLLPCANENGTPNTKLLPCANENGTSNTKLLPCANENGTPNTKLLPCADENDKPIKGCKLKDLKPLPRGSGCTFWPTNFRKLLCSCRSCVDLYKSLKVQFLMDEADTVQAYEDDGKKCREQKSNEDGPENPSQEEQGLQQILSSMDRVKQVEAILGYNDLKTNLKDFLAKFVENKKVVREEDIHEFFSGMRARKRQRTDIPHNCR